MHQFRLRCKTLVLFTADRSFVPDWWLNTEITSEAPSLSPYHRGGSPLNRPSSRGKPEPSAPVKRRRPQPGTGTGYWVSGGPASGATALVSPPHYRSGASMARDGGGLKLYIHVQALSTLIAKSRPSPLQKVSKSLRRLLKGRDKHRT
jgi:hypothetical protein